MPSQPIVLCIAGFDPSSGAGVTADVKTAAAHGCFAISCITALTVQSTAGVRRVEPVRAETVSETLAELAADIQIAAVKLGMLGSGSVARAVASFLEQRRPRNIVLDPILRSSSGTELLDSTGAEILRNRLLPLADVVTPNIQEAAALVGLPVTNLKEMKVAADRLREIGVRAMVVTGGHLDVPVDLLDEGGKKREYPGEKIASNSTHGTGCAFSTALACRLALGVELGEAVGMAKQYVGEAIRSASPIGSGNGPVNHFPDHWAVCP
jgi:hydroxymethylpyrimidine/phosphomethylpyrimidine kinase